MGSTSMAKWPNILHTIRLLYSTMHKMSGLFIPSITRVKAGRHIGTVRACQRQSQLAIFGFGFINTYIPGELGFDLIFKTSHHM